MEHATQFWAPYLLPSLSLVANSGEHTQARNHHSTKRGHFCHAAIMACMHAWINPGNILASQPRAELMVHTTPAIDSSAQVLN